jgi:hypothetical protein
MYLFDLVSFVGHFFGEVIVHFLLAVNLLDLFDHGVDHAHDGHHLDGQCVGHVLVHEGHDD